MSEARLLKEILADIGAEPGLLILRNHVGAAERFDERSNATHYETFGLGEGTPDLVGILAPSGRWFCLEIKTATGRVSPEQAKCHPLWRRFGAFVAVVRSIDEARVALARARSGENE